MDGAIVLESGTNLIDIEANQMTDLYVGNLPLGLHLAQPAQARPAIFIEQDKQAAICTYHLRR